VTATLGTAGQPTAAQFDAVKDAGYEVVINLALGTTPRDLPNEPGIVAAHGIEYVHIPVVFDAPTTISPSFSRRWRPISTRNVLSIALRTRACRPL
jgi:protein tyrosine phosphatase (PTP) superfamily phosphohydrolase (DUF442 family)